LTTHDPAAFGPDAPTGRLELSEPREVAAGIPAVVSTTRHVMREAGLRRGLPLLRHANQHVGFDCPSCAWPDPDGERSFAEFCENGAKAIADAGTRERRHARMDRRLHAGRARPARTGG
jgi:hypothetical protein